VGLWLGVCGGVRGSSGGGTGEVSIHGSTGGQGGEGLLRHR